MKDLGHPARPVFHNESDVDVTTHPDEESDAEEIEDYHSTKSAHFHGSPSTSVST